MANSPNHTTQAPSLPTPASSNHRRARWWIPLATRTGILALFYLLGPVIFLGRGAQLEAGGRVWQAEERWGHVYGSAILSLLWYVPVFVFHSALAGFWTSIFGDLALLLHLPFLRWLGGTAIWLPIPSSMLLRWVLALPLTSWIALLLEAIWPQTTWEAKRVVTPSEQVQLAATQASAEKKSPAAQSSRSPRVQVTASKTDTTGKRLASRSSSPAHAAQAPQPAARAAKHSLSLWDQIDWSQVPDTHPLKQAALEEAERQAAERRNYGRVRRVPDKIARQETASSPPTIESTEASPSPSPPQSLPTYNWDEGEGTVTDS